MCLFGFLLYYYPQIKFYEQKLDHFDHQSEKIFKQRLFIDDSHVNNRPSNMIVTLLSNKHLTVDNPFSSMIVDIAKKYKSLLIGIEPRYYGLSSPFNNTETNNLWAFTIEQNLADIAHIIEDFNFNCTNSQCKTVLVGTRETADLAAWFRIKYPHFCIG